MSQKKVQLGFEFVIPTDKVLDIARTWLSSDDERRRGVAKAIIDVTKEARTVQQSMAADGHVDLAPYFDFWTGDAIASAKHLMKSNDADDRMLAECLINQEEAIVKSKAAFLAEMKRHG